MAQTISEFFLSQKFFIAAALDAQCRTALPARSSNKQKSRLLSKNVRCMPLLFCTCRRKVAKVNFFRAVYSDRTAIRACVTSDGTFR